MKRIALLIGRHWLAILLTAGFGLNTYILFSLNGRVDELSDELRVVTNTRSLMGRGGPDTIGDGVAILLKRTEQIEADIQDIPSAVDAALDDLRYR